MVKIGIVGRYNFSNPPQEILEDLSNPLLIINNKGEIIPILIKSYEILNAGKAYRFHLKPNLTWNNGDKFTVDDLPYNFKGVEKNVIDDLTIEFKLAQPLSTFPTYFIKPIFKDKLVGVAGLYELDNYSIRGDELKSIKLSPNQKNYAYKIFQFYDTENKLINAYKKGEINLIKTSKRNIVDLFTKWKNTKITTTTNYNQIMALFFNNNNKILSTKELREVLVYAVPTFDDLGPSAQGPISPLSWAHNAQLKRYTTDLDKAEAIFKKFADEKDNSELNFYTFYDNLSPAEEIKKNFEKIGLRINLKVLSYLPPDFDMLLTVWNPPQDPDQYYFWHSTQKEGNITGYKNVKVDKLLEDGRKIFNIEERKKIYADFQKNMMEDLPAHFIYYPYIYTIEKK